MAGSLLTPRPVGGGWPAPVSGRRLLVALAAWPVISATLLALVAVPLLLLDRPWLRGHRADAGAIVLALVYVALLAALALAFGGTAGLRDQLGFRFTRGRDLALALTLWLATLLVGGVVTSLLTPVFGQPQSNTVPILRQSFDPLFVGLVVPTVVVLAPAAEELLFRGALLGWLRRRLPWAMAAPLSAAAFAGAHLLPSLLPLLFIFGLTTAFIRERTGSTLNSFAMHMSQNALAVVAAYALISQGQT